MFMSVYTYIHKYNVCYMQYILHISCNIICNILHINFICGVCVCVLCINIYVVNGSQSAEIFKYLETVLVVIIGEWEALPAFNE